MDQAAVKGVRDYAVVTLAYWAFTLTDGALRMLVLLHFHQLGYTPIQLAVLFLFYELFGVVTNLFGGWLAAVVGLRFSLLGGLALQVLALSMLGLANPDWERAVSVAYVMGAQSLSGIAKDLTKMSAKSTLKLLVPDSQQSSLFKWVALLTGSKNALKGVGFFLGGLLLSTLGYSRALYGMAGALVVVLLGAGWALPTARGKSKVKAKWKTLLSKTQAVNVLSAARFFLFGARDIWFVVGVPVFLATSLGWSFAQVGAFSALWVIGYGIVQSMAPFIIGRWTKGLAPDARAAQILALLLTVLTILIVSCLGSSAHQGAVILGGLALFAVIFAVNSSAHSYLILAYSDGDKVAMNVGFYYMANAGGRLVGTLLSGLLFQLGGVAACLWGSAAFAAAAGACSLLLPQRNRTLLLTAVKVDGSD